jgi:uncharacterized protein DUF4439
VIGRRGVLTLGALTGAGVLAACTGTDENPATPPPPSADEQALRRAAATAESLRQAATTLAGSRPAQASLLTQIAAVHQAHVTALGGLAPASGRSPGPTASPGPSAAAPVSLHQLLAAEEAAARVALHDGDVATAPASALLLVRVAAARAADADLLARATEARVPGELRPSPDLADPTPGPSTGAGRTDAGLQQLDRLLAGQHAAVFAYPVVVARAGGARRALARELWAEHRRERDELEAVLQGAGHDPAPAEPAYRIGDLPASGAQAAALAARVEKGLTALAADVVVAATGGTRVTGAAQLVLGARRTAAWTGRPPELLPAEAGSSPSPSVT